MTTSRRDLARSPLFPSVSPDPGELDETAFADALVEDQDAALLLLAEAARATDPRLRALARALAGRVAVRLGRPGRARERGVGRLTHAPLAPGLDVDVEASLEPVLAARAAGRPPAVDELRATAWRRTSTALCLLVDRSGSVAGDRVATSVLAAAAVALRAPDDHSVVAFADRAVVLKAQDERRPVDRVVDDLLVLRGRGTTDLALAFSVAGAQLRRSAARRRLTVLLSDGRPTAGPDPVPAARRLDELVVVAPAGDDDAARALAAGAGARLVTVRGPADVPRALAFLAED